MHRLHHVRGDSYIIYFQKQRGIHGSYFYKEGCGKPENRTQTSDLAVFYLNRPGRSFPYPPSGPSGAAALRAGGWGVLRGGAAPQAQATTPTSR